MSESGSFSDEQRGEAMEADRKGGKPYEYRTSAEINREEAKRIIEQLELRRRQLGLKSPIGRIGLVGGVGVNASEKELRPKPREEPQEES